MLAHHGLVTWGETHEESYGLTLELVERARAFLGAPRARRPAASPTARRPSGFLAAARPALARAAPGARDRPRRSARSPTAPTSSAIAALRSTPDHMLRIGARTCVAAATRRRSTFEQEAASTSDASPGDRAAASPRPRPRLRRGRARRAHGARQARARRALPRARSPRRSTRFGGASWLDEREVVDFEYWPLELYKLTLAAAAAGARRARSSIVTGAASGIGREVARDLAARGAHLVLADLDADGLAETARRSASRPVAGDLTDAAVVDELVARRGRELTAASTRSSSTRASRRPATLGELDEDEWRRSLEVNLTAHFLLTKRVWPVLREQGIGGSLVYVASKNAFAPGAGFGPYSVAKAGLVQLARIAALEGGAARHPRQRRQPRRDLRRLAALVGRAARASAPRRTASRVEELEALLRVAQPARPRR